MKKIFLLFIITSVYSVCVYAQTAISAAGSAPDNSAMLDIIAADKGLLIPRIALQASNLTAPITSPATGLMVYNTVTANTGAAAPPNEISVGFYYWNGSTWQKIVTGNGTFPTGSGTLNYIPKWTPGGTQLGNSSLFDNGKVGLATSNPPTLFSIASAEADFTTGLSFGRTTTSNGKYVLTNSDNQIFRIAFAANGGTTHSDYTNRLVIDANGNIGIGSVLPGGKLDVIGTGFVQKLFTTGNNTYNAADPLAADIVVGSNNNGGTRHDGSIMWWTASGADRILAQNDKFYFSPWSADAITGANAMIGAVSGTDSYYKGNLGIGTAAPAQMLHVGTGSNRYLMVSSLGILTARFDDNSVANIINLENRTMTAVDHGINMNFGLNIGGGAAIQAGQIRVAAEDTYAAAANQDSYMTLSTAANGNLTEKVRIKSDGNVGIGTSTPSVQLHTTGGVRFQGAASTASNTRILTVDGNGVVAYRDPGSWASAGTGDNLGNHTATTALAMGGNAINTATAINSNGDHLELMTNRTDDNSYEWLGFYSGGTRQGIFLYDGAWGGANSLTNEFSLSAENNNKLTLNTNNGDIALMPKVGNVGIGSLSPAFKLDVINNSRFGTVETGAWPGNSVYAYWGNEALDHSNTGNYALLQHTGGTTYLNSASGTPINFRQNNADQMNLTGNVLSFYSPSGNIRGYLHASESLAAGGAGYVIATSGSEHISFKDGGTSGDENMVIRGNTGYIGMGTSNPAQKLDVAGNIRSTGYYYINHTSPSIVFQDSDERNGVIHVNSNRMYFLSGDGTNGTSWSANGSYWPLYFDLNSDAGVFGGPAYFMEGSVGVGTSSPSEAVEVVGNIKYQSIRMSDGGTPVTQQVTTTKRYHVSKRYGTNVQSSIDLDMTIINELCGDEDGCEVRFIMKKWDSNAETAAASRGPWVFFYNQATNRYRMGENDVDGYDSDNAETHIYNWWGCYFSDHRHSSGSQQNDGQVGFTLLTWTGSGTNADKTCEMVFED